MIRWIRGGVLSLILLPAVSGQGGPGSSPLTCRASSATPTIRAEGTSELLGDVLLTCTGGTPTPVGQGVPTADVSLFLNTSVTSRLLNGGLLSEATLLIDEPHSSSRPLIPILNCGQTGAPSVGPLGVCGIQSTGTPLDTYDGTPGHPNAFQAHTTPNAVIFEDVPLDPPGPPTAQNPNPTRILRITNVRADIGGRGDNFDVQAHVAISGSSGPIPIDGTPVVAGIGRNALEFSVQNPTSISSAEFTAGRIGTLRISEGFANAFRPRSVATSEANPLASPVAQDIPGQMYGTESGFGSSNSFNQGLVETGTRLVGTIYGVPRGARIFIPGVDQNDHYARALTAETGPAVLQPLQPNNYYEALPNAFEEISFVYEIFDSDPFAREDFEFPIDMIFPAGSLTQTALITVQVGIAPVGLQAYVAARSSFSHLQGHGAVRDQGAQRLAQGYLALVLDDAYPLNEVRTTAPGGAMRAVTAGGAPCDLSSPESQSSVRLREHCLTHIASGDTRGGGLSVGTQATSQPGLPDAPARAIPGARAATTAWLTANLNANTTPATVTVTANPAGLAPGNYTGSFTVSSTTPGVGPVTVPVTYTVKPANTPKVTGFGVGNAGSYASNVVAPGEAVVVFGSDFGPSQIATLQLDNNVAATLIGETRILFDGVPAPMIYTVAGQASCFVPFSVAGKKFVDMEVEYQGLKSQPVTLAVADAVPGLLTANQSGAGLGAILNQDLSFNSLTGALPGEFVYMFGTGAGQTSPPAQDGRLNPGSTLTIQPIKVFIGGVELPAENVQYAGPAPGLIEGVFQVNIKLPPNTRRNARVPVRIEFGAYSTQPGVTVNIR